MRLESSFCGLQSYSAEVFFLLVEPDPQLRPKLAKKIRQSTRAEEDFQVLRKTDPERRLAPNRVERSKASATTFSQDFRRIRSKRRLASRGANAAAPD